jgi:hypothetical protein
MTEQERLERLKRDEVIAEQVKKHELTPEQRKYQAERSDRYDSSGWGSRETAGVRWGGRER